MPAAGILAPLGFVVANLIVLSALMFSIGVGAVLCAQNPAAPARGGRQAAPPPAAEQGGGRGAQSPASQRPPQTTKPQEYAAEQVRAGGTIFSSQCGFCHGRDAAGGESGPDLTRSTVVAEDVRGNKIAPVLRSGRVDKGDGNRAAVFATSVRHSLAIGDQ